MGFLRSLFGGLLGKEKCRICGTPGARVSGSQTRCLNPQCPNFDPALGGRAPRPLQPQAPPSWRRGQAPQRPLTIRYRNFQGQEKMFSADADSLRRRRNHVSVLVAPSGQRITLSRDRILNLQEVESSLPARLAPDQPYPSRIERQVLGYHKRNNTTSPLYEKIRAKYPNW